MMYTSHHYLLTLMSSQSDSSDVNETKREKDAEIGLLVGVSMLGSAGGGIIAILMETQGLFVVSRCDKFVALFWLLSPSLRISHKYRISVATSHRFRSQFGRSSPEHIHAN